MPLPVVQLDSDRLPSGPWVFARSVHAPRGRPEDGSLVEVLDASGRFVGHGLWNGASDVRVRMLSRGRRGDLARPGEFLLRRLAAADRLRKKVLRLPEVCDAWRVAHAEGDDLSGLVVDRLGPMLVCEYHSLGFWRLREEIAAALGELYPGGQVLHRVPKAARKAEGFDPDEIEAAERGSASREVLLREHGCEFVAVPGRGHKTGWFCDQRDNRVRVGELARGRRVLDLFTNGGGFALQAAARGARRVTAADLDEEVLALAGESARRAGLDVELLHADAYDLLREAVGRTPRPELVVLDPPKFVRGRATLEAGLKRYLDLNALAIEALAPDGLLATFSCSGAVDLATFVGTLFQAGRRAGRGLRLLEVFGAAPDHPQRPEFARSRYLKGALLCVDGRT